MEKIRAGDYTYKEMLQRLKDTEALMSVGLSDNFLILFAYICKQTVAFIRHLNKTTEKFELLKVMAKVSRITIAAILTMVAKYMGDKELLQEMKDITSYSMWLHLNQGFSRKTSKRVIMDKRNMKPIYERDLCISDFHCSARLLQELKKKMARFNSVTSGNKEQVMIVIDELGKNINKISVIVDNMCSYAQKFTLNMREAGRGLNPLISNGNLQVSKFGVHVTRDEEIQQLKRHEDSVSKVMKVLYEATTPFLADLPWYVCDCGADTGLHSCHSIIQDATSTQIKFFTKYGEHRHSLDSIRKIFQGLYEVNQKALTITSRIRAGVTETFSFYLELMGYILDSWVSVKLTLEQFVKKSRHITNLLF